MKLLCPTCHGKGTINDPKCSGTMNYSGPNGESWPQVICLSCDGEGWVDRFIEAKPSSKRSKRVDL